MRLFVAMLALAALAACGQSQQQPQEKAAPPASTAPITDDAALHAAVTDAPTVLRTYQGSEFKTQAHATVTASGGGAAITTDARSGAFSAVLDLGSEATVSTRQLALKVTLQVDHGGYQLVMTHKNWAADYHPFVRRLVAGAGPVTVYLPIDRGGEPLFVISNGGTDGASSGHITSIQLVASPN